MIMVDPVPSRISLYIIGMKQLFHYYCYMEWYYAIVPIVLEEHNRFDQLNFIIVSNTQ